MCECALLPNRQSLGSRCFCRIAGGLQWRHAQVRNGVPHMLVMPFVQSSNDRRGAWRFLCGGAKTGRILTTRPAAGGADLTHAPPLAGGADKCPYTRAHPGGGNGRTPSPPKCKTMPPAPDRVYTSAALGGSVTYPKPRGDLSIQCTSTLAVKLLGLAAP